MDGWKRGRREGGAQSLSQHRGGSGRDRVEEDEVTKVVKDSKLLLLLLLPFFCSPSCPAVGEAV